MSVQSIIQLLGGVGLFLFAIKLISEALQLIAGDRLRQLIGTLTKTPIMGVLVGACVTVLIQSSSATTVMTVSFVDAGLMTLTQAIGVIMGANIGTTITGQILAIKVQDYAYLFIIIGVLLSFFGRSKVQKYAGNGLLGFGLLFVGMQTMESSMSFLRNEKELFLMFSHNPLMGVLAGTLLTLLVQSSAATVGLTIALGVQGLLPLHAAIPIILGDNIGTTITAVLASIGTDRTAKQACAAHSGCHRRKKSAPAAHSAIEDRIDCLDRDQQRHGDLGRDRVDGVHGDHEGGQPALHVGGPASDEAVSPPTRFERVGGPPGACGDHVTVAEEEDATVPGPVSAEPGRQVRTARSHLVDLDPCPDRRERPGQGDDGRLLRAAGVLATGTNQFLRERDDALGVDPFGHLLRAPRVRGGEVDRRHQRVPRCCSANSSNAVPSLSTPSRIRSGEDVAKHRRNEWRWLPESVKAGPGMYATP